MKEIPGNKKLEVAQCYILGLTYKEIEDETGVSHGSVVNIVKELESGKSDIPGTSFDQVNDLRQLSLMVQRVSVDGMDHLESLKLLRLSPHQVAPEG